MGLLAAVAVSHAHAFGVTFIDPAYTWTGFATLPLATRSLAFDGSGSAYAANVTQSPPLIAVGRIDGPAYSSIAATTNYDTSSSLPAFAAGSFVTGLARDGATLYSSESLASQNAGAIRRLSGGVAMVAVLNGHRPTGLAVGPGGQLFYSARLASNPSYGEIFQLGNPVALISVVARGIAVTPGGDIYIATTQSVLGGYLANSIYLFKAGSYGSPGQRIATFDSGAEELALDAQGNLYAIEDFSGTTTQTVRISQTTPSADVPLPSWLFPAVAALLVGLGSAALRRA